jgi:hypothetical protein
MSRVRQERQDPAATSFGIDNQFTDGGMSI